MAKKDEERKRGLPPIQLRAAESASNWISGGWAGSPAGGALGGGHIAATLGLGGKIGIAMLLATLGAGAFGVGRLLAPRDFDANVAAQRLAFAQPEPYHKTSAPPSSSDAQSAMQVVPESLDGKTDAQRAAEDAAAKAAAASLPPPASAASGATAALAPAAPPAAADLTAEARKSPFTAKFGALSTFGAGHGALNGGMGMSSGVGMAFSQKMGPTSAIAQTKPAAKLQARAASAPRVAANRNRGFAYNQLARTNGLSRQGAAASGETSSALASSAFNNSPAGGQVITGGGAGSAPLTGAGAASTGGPIAGSQNSNDGTAAASTASHKNSSPWKMIAMAGVAAMALGTMLLMFAHMKKQAAIKLLHSPVPGSHAAAASMFAMAKMLAMLAAALGAIAAGIGMAMWQQFHQKSYGGIFMAGGGLITLIGVTFLMRSDDKSPGTQVDSTVDSATNAGTDPGTGTGGAIH